MITAECRFLTRQNYLEYDFKYMQTVNRLAALRNRMERDRKFLENYLNQAEPERAAALLSARFSDYCRAFLASGALVSSDRKIPMSIMSGCVEQAEGGKTGVKKHLRKLTADLERLYRETVYQLRLYIKRRDITFNYAVTHGLYPADVRLEPSPDYCMTDAALRRANRALKEKWRVPENREKKRVLIRNSTEMLRVPLELSWEWLLYAMWQKLFRAGISAVDYAPHVRSLANQMLETGLIPGVAVNARYLCELLAQGAAVPEVRWTVRTLGDVFFSVRSLIRLPSPFYAVSDRIGFGIWKMAVL